MSRGSSGRRSVQQVTARVQCECAGSVCRAGRQTGGNEHTQIVSHRIVSTVEAYSGGLLGGLGGELARAGTPRDDRLVATLVHHQCAHCAHTHK